MVPARQQRIKFHFHEIQNKMFSVFDKAEGTMMIFEQSEGGIYSLYLCIRSQWPRGLRRRSAAARLLRSWDRIPPGAWISACCECLLSGRGLCDKLITRPQESYRLWCVAVCDIESSSMRIKHQSLVIELK